MSSEEVFNHDQSSKSPEGSLICCCLSMCMCSIYAASAHRELFPYFEITVTAPPNAPPVKKLFVVLW